MCSLCRISVLAVSCVVLLGGCERERRAFNETALPPPGVSPTTLRAGGGPQPMASPRAAIYEGNGFHLGEGKRYYEWYNCYSCHAAGGGDVGPPLMDDKWRYGGDFEQIRASIAEGRPNGMPSFKDVIPEQQLLQITAYVRSMSGNVPQDAPPSRGDEMYSGPAKTLTDPTPPRDVAPEQPH